MFKKTSNALLALSIGWSVRSIYFALLKSIAVQKVYVPFTTKFIMMLWIMVSSSARVMAIVFFFIPGFGIFSILGHWKLEQTPYSNEVNNRFKENNTVYLFNSEPVSWTDLNRWNYNSDSGPDYTEYTYYSLQEYFFGFWILLFLQICTTALAKLLCSEDFRKNGESPLLFKLIHCVENTNTPTVWMDWEEKNDSVEDHKQRHGQVLREMMVIMLIRSIYNAVMLVPIVYTGKI